MARKKIKLIPKVVIAPVPKTETPSAIETIIGSLTALQATSGWDIIVKVLNDNISYLEKAILEKIDPVSKEDLTDAEVEILRTKRQLNIDLRETPDRYAKVVKDSGEVPENYDPYFKTNKEIEDAKKRVP